MNFLNKRYEADKLNLFHRLRQKKIKKIKKMFLEYLYVD